MGERPQNKTMPKKEVKKQSGYIGTNAAFIQNCDERCRHANSAFFVESTVNQVINKRFVIKQKIR